MRRRHVFWAVFALSFVYLMMCILLERYLEKNLIQDARTHGFIEDLFTPHCSCVEEDNINNGNGHSSQEALSAKKTAKLDTEMCSFIQNDVAKHSVEIQMHTVIQEMPISYPQYIYTHDGYMQKIETNSLKYSTCQWKEEPLRVIVVLHSHNDPGWLKTYAAYYSTSTKPVLNYMVSYLEKDQRLKFVWAEMTYLHRWYEEAHADTQQAFKRLLQRGQIEVVTGGWVMADEAVSHYAAMLDQLIEGHLWLQDAFNYTVKSGWAIDPFGHSSTMAYLLAASEVKNMLIQRTHYSVKNFLAMKKQLEFYWTQNWDWLSRLNIFTHMMPFLSYDIKHSCGPDIQVCCQYDFHGRKCWKWGKYQKPEPITDDNIKEKAEALLHQYRMKAQMFDHNVILVPHGDDFRYLSDTEWKAQTENLKKLFDYMNNRHDMAVKVQFGTLSDYFAAVARSCNLRVPSCVTRREYFPRLSGDFFTYNDRDDQYWSGFFSSRPVLKSAIRRLQSLLRSNELLFTLAQAYMLGLKNHSDVNRLDEIYSDIVKVRRTLGILQHHGAITGTAKSRVVQDYLHMIRFSWDALSKTLEFCLGFLVAPELSGRSRGLEHKVTAKLLKWSLPSHSLPEPTILDLNENSMKWWLSVFNPLTIVRDELVSVYTSVLYVRVMDRHGNRLPCQVSPVLKDGIPVRGQYQVSFPARLKPLGITHYVISQPLDGSTCSLADVEILHSIHNHAIRSEFGMEWKNWYPFIMENTLLSLAFCECTGLLQSVTSKTTGVKHRAEMHFVKYGTGGWKNPLKDKSGAYIFMPDGQARDLAYKKPMVTVVKGPLLSSVLTYLPHGLPKITQKVSLINIEGNSAGSVHIENIVDISHLNNTEIAMRIVTDLNSGHEFYTDLNGFQIHTRKTQSRLPIQGNFYPMSTMMFIQDEYTRISLLSSQSHGTSSLNTGWLEVVLERRLAQDDWRGLNQGIMDNIATVSSFQLLVENRKPTQTQGSSVMGFPSLLAHSLSLSLNNPHLTFKISSIHHDSPEDLEPLNEPLPCDLHLLSLRSLSASQGQALLLLHRLGSDCEFTDIYSECHQNHGIVKWTQLFAQLRIKDIKEMTISGVETGKKPHRSTISVPPMEIKTFKITLTR